MGYRELPPPPALRDALACLWVRRGGPEPVRVLPDACSDLIWRAGQGAFVAGPDTRAWLTAAPPGTVLVGARFHPGAGGPALGWPLDELRDARVPLAEVRPELDPELPADLPVAVAFERMAGVAARLATAAPPHPRIRAAAVRLRDPHARVEGLAGELGWSERQLRRRFHAAVGYGPKTLQRTLRFTGFLGRARAEGAEADLGRLAHEAGYADQPHLSRECRRLAGLAPGALLRSP